MSQYHQSFSPLVDHSDVFEICLKNSWYTLVYTSALFMTMQYTTVQYTTVNYSAEPTCGGYQHTNQIVSPSVDDTKQSYVLDTASWAKVFAKILYQNL